MPLSSLRVCGPRWSSIVMFFPGKCSLDEEIWRVLEMENRPEGANGNGATPRESSTHSQQQNCNRSGQPFHTGSICMHKKTLSHTHTLSGGGVFVTAESGRGARVSRVRGMETFSVLCSSARHHDHVCGIRGPLSVCLSVFPPPGLVGGCLSLCCSCLSVKAGGHTQR